MDFVGKLSFLVFILWVSIYLKKENAEPRNSSILAALSISQPDVLISSPPKPIEYDFYRETCPQAEKVIRSSVHRLYKIRSDVPPALLRLVFHDCFIEGCDASVLLDSIDGADSEKDSPPNETLKGFDIIDIIMSDLEESCPGIVSCADILVLAARESVVLAGGPFYPLETGRRDGILSFSEVAKYELPSPQDSLPHTIASFARRGFNERETVSLLGINKSLPKVEMDSERNGSSFGTLLYFRGLLQARGILYVDQQLTAGEETGTWVRAYASDASLFRRDFALAMRKLSNLGVLTEPMGQVRIRCSKLA